MRGNLLNERPVQFIRMVPRRFPCRMILQGQKPDLIFHTRRTRGEGREGLQGLPVLALSVFTGSMGFWRMFGFRGVFSPQSRL